MGRGCERKLVVHDAWFDERGLPRRVDLEDLAHSGQLEGDASSDRDRSAREPGAGAPWHYGDVVPGRELDHRGDLIAGGGKYHRIRHGALDGRVTLEDS